jgi:23S rRNA pseudoU1915 N3-methylase RlmH
MEKWTKEALDEYFKDDEKNGRLDLQVVNLDVKGNEHFAIEYQLFTKSVVLSLVKNGKEVKSTNLTKVWDHLGDSNKFKTYIKDEVSKYLKEL